MVVTNFLLSTLLQNLSLHTSSTSIKGESTRMVAINELSLKVTTVYTISIDALEQHNDRILAWESGRLEFDSSQVIPPQNSYFEQDCSVKNSRKRSQRVILSTDMNKYPSEFLCQEKNFYSPLRLSN